MSPSSSPGRVSTGARAPAATAATTPDMHCWAKFRPRPQDSYSGEYGFDWIDWKRDPNRRNDEMTKVVDQPIATLSHCYDAHQQQYLPVAKDIHLQSKLQAEYQRLMIYGEDYYAGWLSLRPGQEVKLYMAVEALNQAPVKGDYLTIKTHANYQVTMDGQVGPAIRIAPRAGSSPASPQLVDVTIKCLRPTPDTALQVLDEKGQLVGQLNIVSNARTYHLPVRVVYLVKDGPGTAASLAKLQANFTSLNLEYYLNHRALNQAQIKVEFEKTNQVHQLVFKQAEWAGKFYDVAKNWFTDYRELDKQTNLVKQFILFLDKVAAEYAAKYESKDKTPFRGILLIMTDIIKNPADNQGGVSRVRPVNFRESLIYGTGLIHQELYAHEIGHALGLDHIFLGKDEPADITSLHNSISFIEKYLAPFINQNKDYAAKITSYQSSIAQKQAKLSGSQRLTKAEKQQLEADIQFDKKSIEGYQSLLALSKKTVVSMSKGLNDAKASLATFAANPFKFTQASTDNYMDYYNYPTRFLHWQWKVMQRDVATYYGK